MQKKAIFLMGPTAAGKTDIAISLAQKFPVEIISVDSAMIYKDMDIGTGKPSKEELLKAPHHLIDIISPEDTYSVANFCEDAFMLMNKAISNNKIPLLVGGTMMYFKALLHGLSPLPSSDPGLRQKLTDELKNNGVNAMHKKLEQLDLCSSQRINPNDSQRILRALEVNLLTKKTMNELYEASQKKLDGWLIKNFVVMPTTRKILHTHIKKRFLKMIEDGFIDEVIGLKTRYKLSVDLPSMRSVGYRQIFSYLNNEYSYEEMLEKVIASTRQLAKRQCTWLKSWENKIVFDPLEEKILKKIHKCMQMF